MSEYPVCSLCERQIRVNDAQEKRETIDGQTVTIHTACSRDGILRWLREGRPGHPTDPLKAARELEWSWGGDPVDRGGFDSAAHYAKMDGEDPSRYYEN